MAVGGGVFQDSGQAFQGKHVGMEEAGCLLVDGFLHFFLRNTATSRHISDTFGSQIVFSKRINQAFSDLGCFRYGG